MTTNPVMVPTKQGVLKKEVSFKRLSKLTNNIHELKTTKTNPLHRRRNKKDRQQKPTRQSVFRNASYGSHGHKKSSKKNVNVQSLTYVADESDVWRAHWAIEHYMLRGEFWNHGKFKTIQAYYWIVMTGVMQACIAYAVNMSSKVFIEVSNCNIYIFNFCLILVPLVLSFFLFGNNLKKKSSFFYYEKIINSLPSKIYFKNKINK